MPTAGRVRRGCGENLGGDAELADIVQPGGQAEADPAPAVEAEGVAEPAGVAFDAHAVLSGGRVVLGEGAEPLAGGRVPGGRQRGPPARAVGGSLPASRWS
jgi:hypothetical protein